MEPKVNSTNVKDVVGSWFAWSSVILYYPKLNLITFNRKCRCPCAVLASRISLLNQQILFAVQLEAWTANGPPLAVLRAVSTIHLPHPQWCPLSCSLCPWLISGKAKLLYFQIGQLWRTVYHLNFPDNWIFLCLWITLQFLPLSSPPYRHPLKDSDFQATLINHLLLSALYLRDLTLRQLIISYSLEVFWFSV